MFSFFLLPVRFFLSVRRKSNSVTTSTEPLLFLSNYNWRISGPRQTKHTHAVCWTMCGSTRKVTNATEPTPVDGKPNFLDYMSAPQPYGRDYVFGETRFTDGAKYVSYMYLYVYSYAYTTRYSAQHTFWTNVSISCFLCFGAIPNAVSPVVRVQ